MTLQTAVSDLQERLRLPTRDTRHSDVPTRAGNMPHAPIRHPNTDFTPKIDPKTQQPIPAHSDTLWEVEVKTASPMRNTQETPLGHAVDAVLEVQLLMKGLLDLRRQDV